MEFLKQLLASTAKKTAEVAEIGAIGLDIRKERINLVQMQKSADGHVTISAQLSIPFNGSREAILESPQKLKKLLRKSLGIASFRGRRVIAALDSRAVKMVPLTYAQSSESVDETILNLIDDRIEGSSDDYVIDYIPVRSSPREGKYLALVALAKRTDVTGFLDALNKTGLDIEALDVRPAALTRLVSVMSASEDYETVLVVSFGSKKSFLTIISGRRLLLDQQVEFGEDEVMSQLSSALEMSQQQVSDLLMNVSLEGDNASVRNSELTQMLSDMARPMLMKLVDEISRVMVFSASETRGNPVSKVYLCGNTVQLTMLQNMLSGMLGIPVISMSDEYQKLFQGDQAGREQVPAEVVPEMVIAAGLALRGMKLSA